MSEVSSRMDERSKVLFQEWLRETRNDLKTLQGQVNVSEPGVFETKASEYPQWLIMFIAILSVKLRLDSYKAIHDVSTSCWDLIAEGTGLMPISEAQLTSYLKDIRHFPDKPAAFIFQLFPDLE